MTAPAPSPAEQAVIDRFGIFEPEARVVEEVARALAACHLSGKPYKPQPSGLPRVDWAEFAAAAVAAYRAQDGGAEEAVRRVSALIEPVDVKPTREDRAIAEGLVRRARAAKDYDERDAAREAIALEIATERALAQQADR